MHTFYASLILCVAVTVECTAAQQGYGLCSQVFQMHQYCTSLREVGDRSQDDEFKRGRAGKAGPPGPPGFVNYTLIGEKMSKEFAEMESIIDLKFARYETIINETNSAISEELERQKEVGRGVDAKLARFEEMLNATKQEILAEIRKQEGNREETLYPEDCRNVVRKRAKIWNGTGGVFDIFPYSNNNSVEVYCDLTTDGGGWTVFQRRMDGSEDFFREWDEYVTGFGDADKEMWLGLDTIHTMTKYSDNELRVDLLDWEDNAAYAKYGLFSISDSSDHFRLIVGQYSGDAGESLASEHDGKQFSTRDKDFDTLDGSCANRFKGGWWYSDCYHSNLNGIYYKGGKYTSDNLNGIVWYNWKQDSKYSLKRVEMKFRKKKNV